MVRALKNTPPGRLPSVPSLMLFAAAWGNIGYSGTVRLLRHVCRLMRARPGSRILECGSGASTLLIGALAERYDCRLVSLENDASWAGHMQKLSRRFGLDRVEIVHAPLRSYGHYSWYTYPEALADGTFGAVVCDGPPAATPGGRYGLLPVAGPFLADDCTVLVDDTHRLGERKAISQWRNLRDFNTRFYFATKCFTRIQFV
jgi:predicted O-methyltransferase YrrM